MSIHSLLLSPWAPLTVLLCGLLFYILPYFYTYRHLRGVPGPLLARFSNLWLLYICRKSKRSDTVYDLHERLGPVVRIQPNHVSIVDERAIQLVYGHGKGLEKSSWYDSSISLTRSIFTARNRAEHARKRRYIAHSFAPKSSRAAEGPIADKVELLVRKWDEIIDKGPQFDGFTHLECRRWFTYLSFDITGDLLFSEPFGMLRNGSDLVKIENKPGSYVSMMNSLAQRSAAVATLGVLPWLKPHAHNLPDPFFHRGMDGLQNLLGVTSTHVKERMAAGEDNHDDWLSLLLRARDGQGELLKFEEIASESLTLFMAAIETVSNTLSAMMYYLATSPSSLQKLQTELDCIHVPATVAPFTSVRALPYLDAVLNETMRLHSVLAIGLPREVLPGSKGIQLDSFYFPPGTVLSVPIYAIHRSKDIWGKDANEFRPGRWEKPSDRQNTSFIPFGQGPAACVGRNLAEVEMKIIAATLIKRYDFCLTDSKVESTEGTTRKLKKVNIGIKRRQ
ncbi:putative benzoate 4-monooxygenase cytochrome P450 [Fusarium proliferatum ET1]|uniref:Probable benzoate 4-monooxygenase cytochrome P450 n=1 Tax=Fusarium proliferatum (strain ET1) TaxID=1227346 RepID=A0A1L7W947_FUSPR|nr:putative benzoate 4-monooxygenase cytochrome P450 [Fusarium proliferatum ET1]CZR49130.1 probable benzoate 4-monooxygenase cytochrome P450 [Fusarium proliferatum ET1]